MLVGTPGLSGGAEGVSKWIDGYFKLLLILYRKVRRASVRRSFSDRQWNWEIIFPTLEV